MPYKMDWYIDGQVIYAEIWGEQTMEELEQSNQTILQFLEQADNRLVHIIMRDSKLEKLPVSIAQLQKVLTYSKHPNLGWVMMIGEKEQGIKDAALEFLMLLLAKITRARYTRLKTFDDAVNHLKSVDTTISWETAPSANLD